MMPVLHSTLSALLMHACLPEEKKEREAWDVHNPDGEIGIVPEEVTGAAVVGEDG